MRKGGQETGARNFGISAPSLTHSVHKNIKNKQIKRFKNIALSMYRNSEASEDVQGSNALSFRGLLVRDIGPRYIQQVLVSSRIGFDFRHLI